VSVGNSNRNGLNGALLVVVDLANAIFGVHERGIERIGQLDRLLGAVVKAAPGAIVITFADRHKLEREFQRHGRLWEEIERRNSLAYDEPKKLYLVQYADPPILIAANDLDGAVISSDLYTSHSDLKTGNARYFDVGIRSSLRGRQAEFVERSSGDSLSKVWSSIIESLPDGWMHSNDAEEHERELRRYVNDITWEHTSERLTHRPRFESVAVGGKSTPHMEGRLDVTGDDHFEVADLVVVRVDELFQPRSRNIHRAVVFGCLRSAGGAWGLQWGRSLRAVLDGVPSTIGDYENKWVRVVCRVGVDATGRPVLMVIEGTEIDVRTAEEAVHVKRTVEPHEVVPGPWYMPATSRLWSALRRRPQEDDGAELAPPPPPKTRWQRAKRWILRRIGRVDRSTRWR